MPWRLGRPLAEFRFPITDAGEAAFSDFLRNWQNIPVRLVVDLIEEDFRIETLPHLRGMDRRSVLARRLTQLYRGSPFRTAVIQGRETSGRRDDIALCTAITQSEGLVTWLDILARWRIPLLGIYPAAVLGEALLRAARIEAEQLQLITLLGDGAVRISFFQRGRLKFSRISQPEAGEVRSIADSVREEARKTLQYVGAQSWFLRNAPVQIMVIADAQDARALRGAWTGADSLPTIVSPVDLAQRLGMQRMPSGSSTTGLLLHLLMRRRPSEQLAPRDRTRDGRLWYVRSALFGVSILIAAVAMGLAAIDITQGFNERDATRSLRDTLAADNAQLGQLQARMPASEVSPDRMSAVVRFQHNEIARSPGPLAFLQDLSRALDGQSGLQLRSVQWNVGASPPNPTAGPNGTLDTTALTRTESMLLTSLTPRPFYQEIRVEGAVVPFTGDHGLAVRSVDALAADLRAPERTVQVVRPPFDFDPHHPLSGGALSDLNHEASFVLRIIEVQRP